MVVDHLVVVGNDFFDLRMSLALLGGILVELEGGIGTDSSHLKLIDLDRDPTPTEFKLIENIQGTQAQAEAQGRGRRLNAI
jgi:hypothetical protein